MRHDYCRYIRIASYPAAAAATLTAVAGSAQLPVDRPNQVVGTWTMVSASVEEVGRVTRPYGRRPAGMLVFTPDMHFVEVLTDGEAPRFASGARGGGTDAENRRAMASNIGFFGTYSVDAEGRFAGNRVDGSTFPNWVGGVRTTRELRLTVTGNRMSEVFTRPDGGLVRMEFVRAEPPSHR
jgi:hypothetical protein